ncbi:MAG: hypothetical protein QXE31_02160 [Candidatus Woesearchaeota archaeon]
MIHYKINAKLKKEKKILFLIFISILINLIILANVKSQNYNMSGAQILFNSSETKQPSAAQFLNTSGGSFTTVILSAETQNLKWKAYVGNVTGVLTLDDSGDYSIYQWQLTEITGKVYATRFNNISWSSVRCANLTDIQKEENALNHTTSNVDSINNTFSYNIHKEFYVGNIKINQNSCKSTFTWINNTAQTPSINAPFQEVLLTDNQVLIYTTFINDNTIGYNFQRYDFQMIVPERGVGGYENTRYYFYMELQ